jgi:hypothetical protein
VSIDTTLRPHVYQAINQIVRAFSKLPIGKLHTNAIEQYQYRSIDDVLNRLGPLLARHGLCVLPRVLRRESEDRTGDAGVLLVSVRLLVAFDLVSARDGSRHVVKAWGEALDHGDKGTAKAMSAAYKGAMLQTFCVPVGSAEADSSSYRLKAHSTPEPVEGWSCWAEGLCDMIGGCESIEALDRVRSRYAGLLVALSRARPELYATIGERFSARLKVLQAAVGQIAPVGGRPTDSGKPGAAPAKSRKAVSAPLPLETTSA